MEKRCYKCGEVKPIEALCVDRRGRRADGHYPRCKSCQSQAERERRARQPERYREAARLRYATDSAYRERAAQHERSQARRTAHALRSREDYRRNPKRWIAMRMINHALRAGLLSRPAACQCCGCTPGRIEGHHANYDKPLEVLWCCVKCHRAIHRGELVVGSVASVAPMTPARAASSAACHTEAHDRAVLVGQAALPAAAA